MGIAGALRDLSNGRGNFTTIGCKRTGALLDHRKANNMMNVLVCLLALEGCQTGEIIRLEALPFICISQQQCAELAGELGCVNDGEELWCDREILMQAMKRHSA